MKFITLCGLALFLGLFLSDSPAYGIKPQKAVACTITGTAAADVIRGTAKKDVICARGGNDVIKGLGGNDIIYAGRGNDTVDGGGGNDKLFGEAGVDSIIGGSGINDCAGNRVTFDLGDVLDYASCEDITPPRLISVRSLTPVVDTKWAEQLVQWEIRVTDDLSGLSEYANGQATSMTAACIFYLRPVRGTSQSFEASCTRIGDGDGLQDGAAATVVKRTDDGRVLDAVYIVSERLPRFAARGRWLLDTSVGVQLGDNVGNVAYLPGAAIPGFQNGG